MDGAIVAERRNDSHIVMNIITTLLWKVKKLCLEEQESLGEQEKLMKKEMQGLCIQIN